MARRWSEVKTDLERQTDDIFLTCPDEIKRFRYGIMTHSDAGKHSLDQYFGHWVHAYAGYYGYTNEIAVLLRLANDPSLDIRQMRTVFNALIMSSSPFFAEYGGQHMQARASQAVLEAWDSVETKSQLVDLLTAYHAFMSRLYWWFHWYFPWGIGPVLCHRLSADDIKEIVRLSEPVKV